MIPLLRIHNLTKGYGHMNLKILLALGLIFLSRGILFGQKDTTKELNIRQSYGGKFGFYDPGEGLNNGLIFGIDGVTEFLKYNFALSGAIDLYPKQTISLLDGSNVQVDQQQIILIPIHANFAYKIFDVADAESRGYISAGLGYYLYFYMVDYRSQTGGIFGSLTPHSESKSGGNIFATISARGFIGRIFIEPRLYIASSSSDSVDGASFTIDPSGFAITLGFQY